MEQSVFPELSPRAELFEKVRFLEKSWLDETPLAYPQHLTFLLGKFCFYHIRGTPAEFDDREQRLRAQGLPLGFLSAISNQLLPLIYAIHCQHGQLRLIVGTNQEGDAALSTLLSAHLGPSLSQSASDLQQVNLAAFPNAAALMGIPHYPDHQRVDSQPLAARPTIDQMLLGLLQEEWLYLVQAFPIRREQTNLWLEACAREVKDTKDAFLLRETQRSNRMAAYYVEILEKTINRLKVGKQQGLWQTGVYLLAPDPQIANRGAAIMSSVFSGEKSGPEPVRTKLCQSAGASPFSNWHNSRELQSLVALPGREFPGFCLQEQAVFDVDFATHRPQPINVGQILGHGQPLTTWCSVPVGDLDRHTLVAGVTGSGKTNTIFHLLKELHQSYGIPFLVIEPAKSEYRDLFQEIDSLLVFTLGEERPGMSAPFRLNPFAFPEGISLQTHLDFLKAVFNASFVMYAPMPYVLDECLYKIYEDKGWNLVTSSNWRGICDEAFPTLNDLYRKIDEVVTNLGYQDRTTMDIRAALQTRIKNLCLGGKGMMLNTTATIPLREIMTRPTVLELKYLGNDEEKAFMMGLILMAVWEHYESMGAHERCAAGLRHLTVIEEAHRLLKNVPTEKVSEETSNVKGKGVETFCNLLAEIRAYGEGVLVSEQIPTKLAPDVIKNSNLKILHRMVSKEDRDLIGDSMNLDDRQKRQAVSLKVGEAIFFREGLDRSLLVKVPLWSVPEAKAMMTEKDLHQGMAERFYRQYPHVLQKFVACESCPHHQESCERVKRTVELMCLRDDMDLVRVKFFLPYLWQPERGQVWEHLAALFNLPEGQDELFRCLAAQLVHDYIQAQGNFEAWPFAQMRELSITVQQAISSGDFARVLGQQARAVAPQGKRVSQVCDSFCSYQCLWGYAGQVLARDPLTHNRLADLLNSPRSGARFYLDLVVLVVDYLRDFLPAEQGDCRRHLVLCYLIHKFTELRLAPHWQQEILANVDRALASLA
jgi:hypothetical protein